MIDFKVVTREKRQRNPIFKWRLAGGQPTEQAAVESEKAVHKVQTAFS